MLGISQSYISRLEKES
ncbi:hypothetical protein AAHH72_20840 [Bacillus cereus]